MAKFSVQLTGRNEAHRFIVMTGLNYEYGIPKASLGSAGGDADGATIVGYSRMGQVSLIQAVEAIPGQIAQVEAAEPLAKGDAIASDGVGRACRASEDAIIIGTALDAVAAAGQLAFVKFASGRARAR